MRARKCDRCGKFYDYYKGEQTFRTTEKANAVLFTDRDMNDKYVQRVVYDLCPDCMSSLEQFIKGESAEEEKEGNTDEENSGI